MKNSVPEPSAAASSTLGSTFCCQSTVADAVVATTPIAANVTTAAENAIQRSLLLAKPFNTHLQDRDPRGYLLRATVHIREPWSPRSRANVRHLQRNANRSLRSQERADFRRELSRIATRVGPKVTD